MRPGLYGVLRHVFGPLGSCAPCKAYFRTSGAFPHEAYTCGLESWPAPLNLFIRPWLLLLPEWKAVLHADATPSSASSMLFEPRDAEGLCGTGYDGEGKKKG